ASGVGGTPTPEALALLKSGLAERSNLLVAKAAQVARELAAKSLAPDLVAAFNRFIDSPQNDKGCLAMTAIAETLQQLGASESELYLRGIRHVQPEAG